jgi:hypothetical protein
VAEEREIVGFPLERFSGDEPDLYGKPGGHLAEHEREHVDPMPPPQQLSDEGLREDFRTPPLSEVVISDEDAHEATLPDTRARVRNAPSPPALA